MHRPLMSRVRKCWCFPHRPKTQLSCSLRNTGATEAIRAIARIPRTARTIPDRAGATRLRVTQRRLRRRRLSSLMSARAR